MQQLAKLLHLRGRLAATIAYSTSLGFDKAEIREANVFLKRLNMPNEANIDRRNVSQDAASENT
jgi:hypothetical protein